MRKGKFQAPKTGVKLLGMLLAVALLMCSVIGGTVAWLIDSTDDVVNTFTYGDINLKLEETDTDLDGDDDPNTNKYEMLPGQNIEKDPKVTVLADSADNWLFVKLVKSENFNDFLTYTIGDGWAQLYDAAGDPVEGVYYRFQAQTRADVVIPVLKDNMVSVLETVTKEMLNALDAEGASNYPTLTVTAYAVQYTGFEAVVEEGAAEATPAAVNAAALNAWSKVITSETAPENP